MQATVRHVVVLIPPGSACDRLNEQLIKGFVRKLKNTNASLKTVCPQPTVKYYQGGTPEDAFQFFDKAFSKSIYGVGLIITPFAPVNVPKHIADRSSHVAVIRQSEGVAPPFYPTWHDTPLCFNVTVSTNVEVAAMAMLVYSDIYLMHSYKIIHANTTLKEKQILSAKKVQFLRHVKNTINAYHLKAGASVPYDVMNSKKLREFLKDMPESLPYVSFSSIFLHEYACDYVENLCVSKSEDFHGDAHYLANLMEWFERWLASQDCRLLQKNHIRSILNREFDSPTVTTRLLSKYILSFLNRRLRGQISVNKFLPKILNAKAGTYAFILLKKKPRHLTIEKLNALLAIFPGKQIHSKVWTLQPIHSVNAIPNNLKPYLLIQVLVIVEEV